jgi:hypothetical protein
MEIIKKFGTPKRLLTCGFFGPLLFILLFLAQGLVRADYDPLRHPVSALAIGEQGWLQQVNFIFSGLMILAFALGVRQVIHSSRGSTWGPILIGLTAVGLIGAGFFACDPLNGYPPGTPLFPLERSFHGRLHDLFSLPVFTALPAACFVFVRRFAHERRRGWALYSLAAGLGMLVFFILAGMGFRQLPGFFEIAGLLQRLSIISGLTWISALAAHLLKAVPSGRPADSV